VNRRAFITLLGGAAAWPRAARAQQRERMRRIGVLLPAAPDDAEQQSWLGAFLQGLAQSGWITGRNIRIEIRWTKFDAEETRKYAAELVALARGPANSRDSGRTRPIRRDPGGGAIARGRAAPDRYPGRRGDRTRYPCIRQRPNGGLIAATGGGVLKHRELTVALAARHRLPAVYAYRIHVMSGGLISYGLDNLDQYRRRPATSIASSGERNRLVFRYRRRPSTNS
jgi:hypothetical protein